MPITDADRLRSLLGEGISEGGSESDTLFTNEQIDDLLTRWGSVEDALGEGWETKAAMLVDLVDTAEGDQRRSLSQAHEQALKMAAYYVKKGVAGGRTRSFRIERPRFQG